MDQAPLASPADAPNADETTTRLQKRIADARQRLVETSLRNRLINTRLDTTRTRSLRFFGESSDQVFQVLLGRKQAMSFLPVAPHSSDTPEETVAPPAEPSTGDLLAGLTDDETRTTDNALQTRLDDEALEKRLKSLYYEALEYEEEQGVNVLFLALGFLRWFESPVAEEARYAPLVLLPVELVREGARRSYRLRLRDDDLFTNISLKLFLAEQFDIKLPDLPEDVEWTPSRYMADVAAAVAESPRWHVVTDEMLLGFFSFSKFLLWRDLDPKHWPPGQAPHEHRVIGKLLASTTERAEPSPPLVPANDKLDDHFSPRQLPYVLDADSSQTEAIQTALAGRDLTIQGPPGTGKSQTIANIIAAATKHGKRVLFVAEKMAALEVVNDRLSSTGLGAMCLELHSRKASKVSVHKQLKDAMDLANVSSAGERVLNDLESAQTLLNSHARTLNSALPASGFIPFEVLGALCRLHREGVSAPDFEIPDAARYTRDAFRALRKELGELSARLQAAGVPARNPWRAATGAALSPFAQERLEAIAAQGANAADETVSCLAALRDALRLPEEWAGTASPDTLLQLGATLTLASQVPDLPGDLLDSFASTRDLPGLRVAAQRVEDSRAARLRVTSDLVPGWESHDLADLRVRLAGSGGRVFSFLSGVYRRSLAELRGLARTSLPKGFAARLRLVDDALLASQSTHLTAGLEPELLARIAPIWRGFATDTDELVRLIGWLEAAGETPAEQYRLALRIAGSPSAQGVIELLLQRFEQLSGAAEDLERLVGLPRQEHVDSPLSVQRAQWYEWRESTIHFNDWPAARDQLLALRARLGDALHERLYDGRVTPETLGPLADIAIYEKVWSVIAAQLPELSAVDGIRLDKTVEQFRRLDKERLSLATQEILAAYVEKRPTGNAGEMGIIRQELNKKTKHLSVRRLVKEAGRAMQALKPVFLMSPISVAQFLPPGKLEFDMVLIDEASQVRPEDALGAIARARQVITVGDDKQLPPTNFFNRIIDDTLDNEVEEDEFRLADVESVLALSNIALPDCAMLRWHYRSLHPGLIAVSNRNFYENKLLLPPSTLRSNFAAGMGVSFVRSPANGYARGGSEGGRNVLEAELIAEHVIDFARSFPDKSLGVAAFSVKQRDAIRDMVELKRQENPETEAFFTERRTDHFFVKNLESIQGDERDVIFISVGYGRDADGRLTQGFGPLGAEGGDRRLNVLISRAKERCTVFSSITAEDVRSSPGKPGVHAFREFLQYAEKGYFDVPETSTRDYGSEFEESVAMFLRTHGYDVHPQVGMAGFFIDLGIVDPDDPTRYVCGIECDGATYHSSRSARDRDRLRQAILESRGWTLYRIWSTDWFHRRQQQEQKLLDSLAEMVRKGPRVPPPSTKPSRPVPVPNAGLKPAPAAVPGNAREAQVAQNTARAEMYVEFRSRIKATGEPHTWPLATMVGIVERIVGTEGPIHEEEVGRRVARCAGKQQAGPRIQRVVRDGLAASPNLVSDGAFWMTRDAPVVVRTRAGVESSTLLKAAAFSPVEIMLALVRVVRESVRIEREELVQQTSRLFGFQRCGPDLRDAIGQVLERNLGPGKVLRSGVDGKVEMAGQADV